MWPDVDHPDLLLSVGSGNSPELHGYEDRKHHTITNARTGIVSHGRKLYNIARMNMEVTLDCERSWNDYFASVATGMGTTMATSKYARVDPQIPGPEPFPQLDEKDRVREVQKKAYDVLTAPGWDSKKISTIARQLIASSFYFDLTSTAEERNGSRLGQGTYHTFGPSLQENS